MRISQLVMTVATVFALGLSGTAAMADEAGDKALATTEAALNKGATHFFEYDATTSEPGKNDKSASFTVRVKGDKRLTEYASPADLKGTQVLILSPTEMYVYLPSFGKVRRIARGADQAAFGMAFSQDDLATQKYSNAYQATQSGDVLTLTPKSGQTTSFAKIEMTISKDKKLPSEIKYYNSDNKLVKTELRSGYTCESDVCTPGMLRMVDATTNLTTTLVRKKWKVNEAIADETFLKSKLGI